MTSEVVRPVRVEECSVHLEARVPALDQLGGEKLSQLGGGVAAEVEVVRVHVDEQYILKGTHIDPAKWYRLSDNFRHYFRPADHELGKTFRAEA